MATISDLATIAAATAAGYRLTTHQGVNALQYALLSKPVIGITSGAGEIRAYGENASATVAKANALSSLNAARRHHYAGSPGVASGATVAANMHGDTPVVDTN